MGLPCVASLRMTSKRPMRFLAHTHFQWYLLDGAMPRNTSDVQAPGVQRLCGARSPPVGTPSIVPSPYQDSDLAPATVPSTTPYSSTHVDDQPPCAHSTTFRGHTYHRAHIATKPRCQTCGMASARVWFRRFTARLEFATRASQIVHVRKRPKRAAQL